MGKGAMEMMALALILSGESGLLPSDMYPMVPLNVLASHLAAFSGSNHIDVSDPGQTFFSPNDGRRTTTYSALVHSDEQLQCGISVPSLTFGPSHTFASLQPFKVYLSTSLHSLVLLSTMYSVHTTKKIMPKASRTRTPWCGCDNSHEHMP